MKNRRGTWECSSSREIISSVEKNFSRETRKDPFRFRLSIPTLNWKDVLKELDHLAFMVRDRQGFLLLITALRRALPVEQFVDQLYARWTHLEGQPIVLVGPIDPLSRDLLFGRLSNSQCGDRMSKISPRRFERCLAVAIVKSDRIVVENC